MARVTPRIYETIEAVPADIPATATFQTGSFLESLTISDAILADPMATRTLLRSIPNGRHRLALLRTTQSRVINQRKSSMAIVKACDASLGGIKKEVRKEIENV